MKKSDDENLFAEDVLYRLKQYIEKSFDKQGIKYEEKVDPRDVVVDYFAWLFRQIPPVGRDVTYSKEIQEKIEKGYIDSNHVSILEMFKQRFENGDDMNVFLSTLIFDAEKIDYLRYTWHIYHFHLSKTVAQNESEIHFNRADQQLLAIITNKEVLFIDVIQHPAWGKSHEYFDLDHLRIVRDNGWFEKIGFKEIDNMIPGSLLPKITTSKDIYDLYRHKLNVCFEFEGKGYMLLGHIVLSGRPMEAVDACNRIVDNIHKVYADGIKCDYIRFEADPDNHLAVMVRIKTCNGEKHYYDLLQLRELIVDESKLEDSVMSNVLVAGGTGFIGSHLIDSLLAEGHRVICADKLIMGRQNIDHINEHSNFKFYEVELADQSKVDEIFAAENIDVVYHLAANSDIQKGGKEPSIDFNDTLLTTRALLEGMRKYNVKKLFFASTSAVYGEVMDVELTETTGGIMPVSYYGGTKLASEALISSYVSMCDMSAVIFRFPNVIGPRLTHGAVFDFIRKLRKNPAELEILGNGTQCKPYIYVLDLVEAIMKLTKDFASGEVVYNISVTSPGTTVTHIAEIVVEELGLQNVKFNYTGGDRGWKGDVPRFSYDISKVLATGWLPKHTSDEAVRQTVKDAIKVGM